MRIKIKSYKIIRKQIELTCNNISETLQFLIGCKELNDYFKAQTYQADLIQDNNKFNSILLKLYIKWLRKTIDSSEIQINSLLDFVNCLNQLYPHINNKENKQHNIIEFLKVFIDYLKSSFRQSSLIHRLFNGILEKALTCLKCNEKTITKKFFGVLNFSLELNYHIVDCYYYFNSNQTQPLLFQYSLSDNTTISDMNLAITEALSIHSNCLEIILFNKDKFQNVT